MLPPLMPENEAERLAALENLKLLDTDAEERFDRLTRLAQRLFNVQIALVSLVDAERQWFKSKQGLEACETGRDISFCGHAILDDVIFEVPDASKDQRFADNPLVTGPPDIRFYAGVPLSTVDGYHIGTLCIIDASPRHLSEEDRRALKDIANLVESEINHVRLQEQSKSLQAAQLLGDIITRAQSEFILKDNRQEAFDSLLNDILKLTESEYGFIGEVLKNKAGQHYLKTYAITDISWDVQSRKHYEEHAPKGMEFTNLNSLYGVVMRTGEVVIANEPEQDSRSGGLPEGHPPLKAFLGIPIFFSRQLVAMLGVANRKEGYSPELVDFLRPLLATLGQLVVATRLQQEQQESRQELARLSRVVSQTTNSVVVTDTEGRLQWVNDGFVHRTGYRLDEVKGRQPGEFLQGPDSDPAVISRMHKALSQKKGFVADIINYTKQGEPYWVRINCNPIYAENGALEGYIAIQLDITDEKRAKEQLLASNKLIARQLEAFSILNELAANASLTTAEQLQRALKVGRDYLNLKAGIVSRIKGNDYKVVAVSAPDDSGIFIGQHFLLGDTYCDLVIKADDLVALHHMGESEYRNHPCYTGIGLEAYIGVALEVEGQRYGTLNFSSVEARNDAFNDTDKLFVRLLAKWVSAILERDRSAKEVKRSESRLRGLFELSPLGIALNELETGKFIDLNPALLAPTGYQRDEFVELSYWDITPIEYQATEAEQLEKLNKTGRYGPYEKEYIRRDGSRYPVMLNGMLVEEAGGKKLIWSIVEDISERKRIERMKNEFISTVSHELRTPLTAISGALGLIKGGVAGELSEGMSKMLNVAFKNSQRLNLLINDLLDMEKLLAGKMSFDFQVYKTCDLLEQAIEVTQSYADQFQVQLHLRECVTELYIKVDAARFAQVMSNLLSNAAKFSPEGATVEVSARSEQNRVRIAVRDYGSGIPEEFQARIFQKFSQADSSDTRQKGGTGLGLAISRELVERMNGKIGFDSSPEGTEFFICFPAMMRQQ